MISDVILAVELSSMTPWITLTTAGVFVLSYPPRYKNFEFAPVVAMLLVRISGASGDYQPPAARASSGTKYAPLTVPTPEARS